MPRAVSGRVVDLLRERSGETGTSEQRLVERLLLHPAVQDGSTTPQELIERLRQVLGHDDIAWRRRYVQRIAARNARSRVGRSELGVPERCGHQAFRTGARGAVRDVRLINIDDAPLPGCDR
jgi:hypothetical protein